MSITQTYHPIRRVCVGIGRAAVLAALAAALPMPAAQAEPAAVQRIQADNACYVKLPDLPQAVYGGFGGYNADTGVLTFAGGADKQTQDKYFTHYDLFAIKLNAETAKWNTVLYGGGVGYVREQGKGCREMFSMHAGGGKWASVLGADGCDNGNINGNGGDVRILDIGATPDRTGVKWTMDALNVSSVPAELASEAGRLTRLWSVVDAGRGRVVFGQGTFDDTNDQKSIDEVYSATPAGLKWNVRSMSPGGSMPARRFGSCAAYVADKATGVDGIIVVGGRAGGAAGAAFNEVWWLDFAKGGNAGTWANITSRFANQNDYGARYDMACAYNGATKHFYTWAGHADPRVPDGAASSAGLWRVDLTALGDAAAPLTWQRLAKDNLAGIEGRSIIPSVFDWKQNRLFLMAGRGKTDLTELSDVWAVYPDVTGEACAGLDPYAPFASVPTPTPTGVPPTPPTPGGGPTKVPTTVPTPPGPVAPSVCPNLDKLVPRAAIDAAVANPASVQGYDQLCNPNLPASPNNPKRGRLGLQNPAGPYHPLFNSVVYKCGCP